MPQLLKLRTVARQRHSPADFPATAKPRPVLAGAGVGVFIMVLVVCISVFPVVGLLCVCIFGLLSPA